MTYWQITLGIVSAVLGYLLTLALLPVVLLTKKQQTVSTVAWMMAIVTMPIIGAVLFLVFGINRVDRRLRGRKESTLILSRDVARWQSSHHAVQQRADAADSPVADAALSPASPERGRRSATRCCS